MKTIKLKILLAVVFALCVVNISSAEDCKNAEKLLNKAISLKPDANTEKKINAAIALCPNRASLYETTGDYYSKWFEDETDSGSKAGYKKLAIKYYTQGAEHANSHTAERMKIKTENLEGNREWSNMGFRGLVLVAPDAKDMGLSLRINFELNSYELTHTAQKHLDELGEELAASKSIRISLQGHTDMYGTAPYNKKLSIRRAESAKNYLVNNFNISPERIVTLGYGFERLADKDNPYNPVNRRVEVLKIAQ